MLQLNNLLYAFNKSEVIGGQEVYLNRLQVAFRALGLQFKVYGTPRAVCDFKQLPPSLSGGYLMLNGNSALYHFAFKKMPAKHVIYVQHSSINDGQGAFWKRIIRKFALFLLLKRVDLVVRVCDAALPLYYAPRKIITIHNGVQLPDCPPPKYKQSITKLLMVGALTANKNQALAIEALTHLPTMHLTIVGDGPERRSLEAKTKELGLCKRVVFVGFTEQPEKYYSQCDLLLMLSYFEAFPLVVLEAMARYCPVLSVKVGGVPEVLEHKVNGWLMDGYCVQTLVADINAINADITGYNNVAHSARKTIEAGFTEQHMVDKLLTEINKRYK